MKKISAERQHLVILIYLLIFKPGLLYHQVEKTRNLQMRIISRLIKFYNKMFMDPIKHHSRIKFYEFSENAIFGIVFMWEQAELEYQERPGIE